MKVNIKRSDLNKQNFNYEMIDKDEEPIITTQGIIESLYRVYKTGRGVSN